MEVDTSGAVATAPPATAATPRRLAQYVAWLDRVKYFVLLGWIAILAVALSQVGRVFARRAATLASPPAAPSHARAA